QLYRLSRAETLQGGLNGDLLRNDIYEYSFNGDIIKNGESNSTGVYGDNLHPGRLTSFKATSGEEATLEYDAGGKLIKNENLTNLTYDIWDRLVSATTKDGSVVKFEYDHTSACVRKEITTNDISTSTFAFEKYYEETATQKRLNIFLGKLLVATKIE